jgi:hypothetical protein
LSSPDDRFGDVVLAALDKALSIVGDTGRTLVFEALQNRYGVTRKAVPENIEYLCKTMEFYLGNAAPAVKDEARIWIKEWTGVDGGTFEKSVEELRTQIRAEKSGQGTKASRAGAWKMDVQSTSPPEEDESHYMYKAKFSFGPPQGPAKESDYESRQALEAYLKSIVEKHMSEKHPKKGSAD